MNCNRYSKLKLPVHEAIAIRDSTVAEMEQELMSRLRTQRHEVPEHVGVLQVSLWISFLRVDEAWEEHRVANEEDWRIVADQIPNSVLGVEFGCETTRIAKSVSRSALAAY